MHTSSGGMASLLPLAIVKHVARLFCIQPSCVPAFLVLEHSGVRYKVKDKAERDKSDLGKETQEWALGKVFT